MWKTLAGAGVLAIRGGLVLMELRHRSGKIRWELPSGLIEKREVLEATALRETLEETGIHVQIERLLCTIVMDVPSESFRAINVYFIGEANGREIPQPGGDDPIVQVGFIDPFSIPSKDIHPVDRRILARWHRRKDERPFYFRITL